MQTWAGIAIAQAIVIAVSVWRLAKTERVLWWPGIVMFVLAALAMPVLVGYGGAWSAIAIFGTIVLASDALLLAGALVTSLCTRPAEPTQGEE
jgi:hypothetical protein